MKKYYQLLARIIASLAVVAIVTEGCQSTQKLINTGNYDIAIARSVNKLRKNKTKEKHILLLEEAYHKANKRDLDRINFLKKEAASGNSVEVFRLYENIQERQNKVRPLMPLYVNDVQVDFTFLNIENELITWKREAADFLYRNAVDLLAKNDKYLAREAYDQLLELSEMYPHYKDVDDQLQQAFNLGTNWVLFNVINRSPNLVPVEFVDELYALDFRTIEGKWFKIVTKRDQRPSDRFDYRIDMVVDLVDVGPERQVEKVYTETKEIQDGWVYEYDKNGNVKKDSSGNDIKQPKYKEISADITEILQTKAATFKGRMEIFDMAENRVERTEPVNVNFVFNHPSAVVAGNVKALKPETAEKVKNKPVPFPSDFQMIMDGSQEIRPVVQNFIRRYKALLES